VEGNHPSPLTLPSPLRGEGERHTVAKKRAGAPSVPAIL
jgi:hypothetical protein